MTDTHENPPARFRHTCARCEYSVDLEDDESECSVCPNCADAGQEGKFNVTRLQEPTP